jgi:hypothetical protein
MGTRSTIALEFADGTVQQVYCHWDGYLEHNGKILQEHYSDPFKLRELIDLGDLSSLRKDIGEKHAFSKFELATQIEQRLHEEATENMCTFYGRDRNESGCAAKRFKDYADYVANHQYEEYEYILRACGDKAVWFVADHSDTYVPLSLAFEKESECVE